jgi:sugar lactone lactonase YvrE
MFCRDFRRFLVRTLLWVTGIAMGGRLCADEYPVLRSNRLAYAIGRAEWDGPRNALYLTDQFANRLVRVDLGTGEETAAVRFTRTPEALRLSPDGSKLYVATLGGPHNGPFLEGYLQVIDTTTFRQVDEMKLQVDPYSLAVNDAGIVLVAGTKNQPVLLDTYDMPTHRRLGGMELSYQLYSVPALTPHPDQTRFYLWHWSSVARLAPLQDTGIYTMATRRDAYGGELFVFPDGLRAVDKEMAVFSTGVDATNDLVMTGLLGSLEGNGVPTHFDQLAFDRANGCFFTVSGLQLSRFNSTSLLKVGSGSPGGYAKWLFATEDHLFAVLALNQESALVKYPNPAKGARTNRAPVAVIASAPQAPTTLDVIRFDAGGTTDDGPADELRFQWDWDGDGTYDTSFSESPFGSHRFNIAGAHVVRLRAVDRFGAEHVKELSLTVALRADPGIQPVTATPFRIPFTAAGAVFDPVRPAAYAIDHAGRRLVSMDMNTGRMIRSYSFDYMPEALAITADGRWLYVAFTARPDDVHNYSGLRRGFVAEFDLVAGHKTREFEVATDPWKIAVTASRKVILISGSPPVTGMVFDGSTGDLLRQFDCRDPADVVMAPAQDSYLVFAVAGGDTRQYSADPIGENSILRYGSMSDTKPFVILPDGVRAIGGGGGVYELSGEIIRPLPGSSLEIGGHQAAVADATNRPALFTVADSELRFFNTQTYKLARTIPLPRASQFLGRTGDRIFYAAAGTSDTVFGEVPNPALGMETNRPPVMVAGVVTEHPAARRPVTFDAGASTDDEDVAGQLLFRWDADGDGVFDSPWTNRTTFTWSYVVAGDYPVLGEVRDRRGATNAWTGTVRVDESEEPGETLVATEPWRLPYEAADVEFDPVRPLLWAADGDGRAVVRVNLTNGLPEKRWALPHRPVALAITPDGRFLYIAMIHPAHDISFPTNGYVAEIDLQAEVLRRVMLVDADPMDIAADSNGLVFLALQGSVRCYNASDWEPRGYDNQAWTTGTRLRLSPDRNRLYAANEFANQNPLRRYVYDPATGRFPEVTWMPPVNGEMLRSVSGRVFILSGETRLLGGGGGIVTNVPGSPDDLRIGESIGTPVLDCVALPGTEELLVAGGPSSGYYRADTLELISGFRTGSPAQYAGAYPGRHFLVGTGDGVTVISPRIHPVAATNLPPRLRWLGPDVSRATPENHPVLLQVEADDADGGIRSVAFYVGGVQIGTRTEPPFTLQWYVDGPGTNYVVALATDDRGALGTPVTNIVRVTRLPSVSWISPQIPAVPDPGADFVLEAAAADADGSVRRVDFYSSEANDGIFLGSATNAPWRFTLTNLPSRFLKGYWAVAIDNDGASNSTDFRWVQTAGARGDDYYRPFEFPPAASTVRASNADATSQFSERPILGGASRRSLWWTWTAPASGIYRVNTFSSEVDTLLAVYADSPVINSAALVAANDDAPLNSPASEVKFRAGRGRTYRFAVASKSGATGTVALSVEFESAAEDAASNDAFDLRTVMSGDRWQTDASNLFATSELDEPLHATGRSGASLWWEWTAPAGGLVELSTVGSDIDTVLAVYTRATPLALATLRTAGRNDDDPRGGTLSSRVLFMAAPGVTYYIAVAGFEGQTGPLRLALNLGAQQAETPVNDNYADAILIGGESGFIDGHNYGATSQAYEFGAGPQGAMTVWYRWRCPRDSYAYFKPVAGNTNPVGTAVFTGGTFFDADRVPTVQNDGAVRFRATAGTVYSIELYTVADRPATFTLLWSTGDLPSPPRMILSLRDDGVVEIGYGDFFPLTGTIMASPDLKTWEPVGTYTFQTGQRIALPRREGAQEFYRLVFP